VINHPVEARGLRRSNVPTVRRRDGCGGDHVEALSINPFGIAPNTTRSAELIKIQNEKLAEFCAPTRPLCRFATVALQHPDLAVEQLNTRSGRWNLRGLSIDGSVATGRISRRNSTGRAKAEGSAS
jgi:aminocarboxymuconate-semialdehyde decarboxylase